MSDPLNESRQGVYSIMVQTPVAAIAPQLEDELRSASTELAAHLEEVANAIAPDHSFDYVHVDHQEFAMLAAREFNHTILLWTCKI